MLFKNIKNKLLTLLESAYFHIKPIFLFLWRALIIGLVFLMYFSIGFFVGSESYKSRTIYYASELEKITLVYGGPTIFRFNEVYDSLG